MNIGALDKRKGSGEWQGERWEYEVISLLVGKRGRYQWGSPGNASRISL